MLKRNLLHKKAGRQGGTAGGSTPPLRVSQLRPETESSVHAQGPEEEESVHRRERQLGFDRSEDRGRERAEWKAEGPLRARGDHVGI